MKREWYDGTAREVHTSIMPRVLSMLEQDGFNIDDWRLVLWSRSAVILAKARDAFTELRVKLNLNSAWRGNGQGGYAVPYAFVQWELWLSGGNLVESDHCHAGFSVPPGTLPADFFHAIGSKAAAELHYCPACSRPVRYALADHLVNTDECAAALKYGKPPVSEAFTAFVQNVRVLVAKDIGGNRGAERHTVRHHYWRDGQWRTPNANVLPLFIGDREVGYRMRPLHLAIAQYLRTKWRFLPNRTRNPGELTDEFIRLEAAIIGLPKDSGLAGDVQLYNDLGMSVEDVEPLVAALGKRRKAK